MAKKHPLSWLFSLYFAEGLPYTMVVVVSTVMYKNLGISNAENTFYTGLLSFPWVIKPFWSPLIDHYKSTRNWIVLTQFIMGIIFGLIALSLPLDGFFKWSLICFELIAFSSATHDIAADGFYIQALNSHQQSFYVGFRSLFYRVAMITVQGGIVAAVGLLNKQGVAMHQAWSYAMISLAILFIAFSLYHKHILPHPEKTKDSNNYDMEAWRNYLNTFVDFFKKKGIIPAILFILLYRLGEAQLTKIASPFLLDSREVGGLALNNEQLGLAYGTIGIIGLVIGGIVGGILVSKHGLKFWIWPMALSMKLPDVVYVLLAHFQPENIHLVQGAIFFEQFGYGFGFTAFMLYLLSLAKGKHSTAHYAFATGIMALGMMIPGMLSGLVQEHIGYTQFFIWVMICTIPGLALIPFLKIDKNFGKKN